jgi:hypothetical protein
VEQRHARKRWCVWPKQPRASTFHVLDRAGRLLGRELRRREPNKDR